MTLKERIEIKTKIVRQTIKELNMLRRRHPEMFQGIWLHPGSILNAYVEGSLTFKQAVRELNLWKKAKR